MPPLEPADRGLLGDIIAYGQRAIRHLGSMSADQFATDEKTQDSVVRCLAIVGEAAWKASDTLRRTHPTVPWPLVAGMRHRLVHDYGAVDLRTVYRVICEHLPALIDQAKGIIAAEAPPSP
jgi:uncharacterized protein with HEPN domain